MLRVLNIVYEVGWFCVVLKRGIKMKFFILYILH